MRHVKYVLRDDDGNIVQRGICDADLLEAQARDGLTAEECDWIEPEPSFAELQAIALQRVDDFYATLVSSAFGPFAPVHRLKLEQAQAGGGPLIADEDERLAILQRAAEQAELVAAFEPARIAAKKAILAAETVEQIEAVIAGLAL